MRLPISPDLVSATVETSQAEVRIAVRFAPGTFDRNSSSIEIRLDTDENTATGLPGIGAEGTDAALIGVDYIVKSLRPGFGPPRNGVHRCPVRRPSACTVAGEPTSRL